MYHHQNKIKTKTENFESRIKTPTGTIFSKKKILMIIRICKDSKKVYLLTKVLEEAFLKRICISIRATEFLEIEYQNSETKMKEYFGLLNKVRKCPDKKF